MLDSETATGLEKVVAQTLDPHTPLKITTVLRLHHRISGEDDFTIASQ